MVDGGVTLDLLSGAVVGLTAKAQRVQRSQREAGGAWNRMRRSGGSPNSVFIVSIVSVRLPSQPQGKPARQRVQERRLALLSALFGGCEFRVKNDPRRGEPETRNTELLLLPHGAGFRPWRGDSFGRGGGGRMSLPFRAQSPPRRTDGSLHSVRFHYFRFGLSLGSTNRIGMVSPSRPPAEPNGRNQGSPCR